MSMLFNTPVVNPPTVIVAGAGGVAAVDLLGGASLVAGGRYAVTLQNPLSADRGGAAYQTTIAGWIKCSNAIDVTAENGTPIDVNTPVEVNAVTGKLRLSFIRNNDTPVACKIFVVRVDQ